MFKRFFLFLIACFVFYEVHVIEPVNAQIKHPYFWKVEKDGKTSHLLGVVHEPIPINELLCPQEIKHRLKSSDLVFVELDHRTEKSRKAIDTQEQLMLSTDGREFRSLSRKSQEFLRSRGVGEQWNFYGYKALLSNLCKYGVSRVDGLKLDEQVTDLAYSSGISVYELDDFHKKYDGVKEEQKKKSDFYNGLLETESVFKVEINVLNNRIDRFLKECSSEWLVDTTKDYNSGKRTLDLVQASMTALDIHLYLNLMERNIQWVNRFEEARQNHERIFLAGGLAHFVFNPFDNPMGAGDVEIIMTSDPFNVVELLRVKGYTVERVTCEK